MTRSSFPFINKEMAIKRCPYCKAIIEEGSEFCSNCGTQLLFPEDEFLEEEIPGEKIVDEEVEGKKEEAEGSISEETEPEEKDEVADLLKEEAEGEVQESVEGETGEEIPPVEAEELKAEEAPSEEEVKEDTGEPSPEEPSPEEPLEVKEEKPETEETFLPEVGEKKEGEEIDFELDELEGGPELEEKEKERIEEFLESVRKDRAKRDQISDEEVPPSPPVEKEEATETFERSKIPTAEIPKTDEVIPPWAKKIKDLKPSDISEHLDEAAAEAATAAEVAAEATVTDVVEDKVTEAEAEIAAEAAEEKKIAEEAEIESVEEKVKEAEAPAEEVAAEEAESVAKDVITEEEVPAEEPEAVTREIAAEEVEVPTETPLEEEKRDEHLEPEEDIHEMEDKALAYEPITPDTGGDVPERMVQKRFPFSDRVTKERARRQRRSRFLVTLQSIAFDFLFIAVFWIASLWIASRLMEVSLFKLISVSALPALGFYLILLGGYFILFLSFLGRTLGYYLFYQEE